MSERRELEAEVATFARYLSDADPDPFVVGKYVAAHDAGAVEPPGTSRHERSVVALARRSAALTRMLDAHSRVFANGNLLRRKLVLVLALLETRSPGAERLDTAAPGSRLALFARIAAFGALFAVRVILAALLLVPVRIAGAFRGSR
jgi:hypothetical protein